MGPTHEAVPVTEVITCVLHSMWHFEMLPEISTNGFHGFLTITWAISICNYSVIEGDSIVSSKRPSMKNRKS